MIQGAQALEQSSCESRRQCLLHGAKRLSKSFIARSLYENKHLFDTYVFSCLNSKMGITMAFYPCGEASGVVEQGP